MMPKRLKVLLIAPYYDKNVPGESWSTYKWIDGISHHHDVTVLTTHREEWDSSSSPTAAQEIVNWSYKSLPVKLSRLERELKPSYLRFYLRARKWIKKALEDGRTFDLIHQINPLALRYPFPAYDAGIPYIMGPLAGSLKTPEGFSSEGGDKQWYRKFRNLDEFRIKRDPILHKSYKNAALILGAAPYVEETLKSTNPARFLTCSETGIESLKVNRIRRRESNQPLKLLYVGRIIRTKGVIDAIRAVAAAREKANVTFTIIGAGDMDEACKNEIARLKLDDTVKMLGHIPRATVDEWYENSDLFLFPSFREPSGNVVFEALNHGLPLITTDRGGPGFVVDDSCGIRTEVIEPQQFAADLAKAIVQVYQEDGLLETLSQGAQSRIEETAYWPKKIDWIHAQYKSITS